MICEEEGEEEMQAEEADQEMDEGMDGTEEEVAPSVSHARPPQHPSSKL